MQLSSGCLGTEGYLIPRFMGPSALITGIENWCDGSRRKHFLPNLSSRVDHTLRNACVDNTSRKSWLSVWRIGFLAVRLEGKPCNARSIIRSDSVLTSLTSILAEVRAFEFLLHLLQRNLMSLNNGNDSNGRLNYSSAHFPGFHPRKRFTLNSVDFLRLRLLHDCDPESKPIEGTPRLLRDRYFLRRTRTTGVGRKRGIRSGKTHCYSRQ